MNIMTTLIILVVLVILGSGIFSGIEAALFSVSKSRVIVLKEYKKRGSKELLSIKENISQAIIVIVICNNIVNIVGSMFVGVLASKVFGSLWIGLISAIVTILIIIFGEILPKTIGENHAEKISLLIAPVIIFGIKILKPIVWLIEKLTKKFVVSKKIVSEEELYMLSEIGHLEGSIEKDEKDIIQKVFTLNDITASDIMTPRTVIVSFQKDIVIGDIKDDIYSLNNSRIPVFRDSVDDIIGICYRKHLLIALAKDEDNRTIESFSNNVLYIRDDMKVDDLLQLFLIRHEQFAIVKDEFDGTSGIVTIEDVLEQLVGEIVDEDDEVVDTRLKAQHKAEKSDIVVEEAEEHLDLDEKE